MGDDEGRAVAGETSIVRDGVVALSLLTIVPVRGRVPEFGRSAAAAWFPAVGLALGSVVWGAVHLARALEWRSTAAWVVAALCVMTWAALTRLLHWDGLADVADGLLGGHTPERRLEIMADSATGAFGATAIALVAIVQVAAIGSILTGQHEMPLLVVPCLARLAPTCAAWLGRPARDDGLGRSVMGRPGVAEIAVAASFVGTCVWALWWGYGLSGAVLGAVAVAAALVVPHVFSEPLGGVTGDVMGASVLVCETLLFAAAAVMWGV